MAKIMGKHIKSPDTNWASHVLVVDGCGTLANLKSYWRRVDDYAEYTGSFTVGTPTAVPAAFNLVSGQVIDSAKAGTDSVFIVGNLATSTGTNPNSYPATALGPKALFTDLSTSATKVYFTIGSNTNVWLKANGSSEFGAGYPITYWFKVPIVGWSSNDILRISDGSKV
jgi:hypothetical protein